MAAARLNDGSPSASRTSTRPRPKPKAKPSTPAQRAAQITKSAQDDQASQTAEDKKFNMLHPRGADGTFIEKDGDVYVKDKDGNDERGKVLSVDKNGATVQFADGSTMHISPDALARRVTQAPPAKARLNKGGGGGKGGGSSQTPAQKAAQQKATNDRQDRIRAQTNARQDKIRAENNARQDRIRAENNARQDRIRAEKNAGGGGGGGTAKPGTPAAKAQAAKKAATDKTKAEHVKARAAQKMATATKKAEHAKAMAAKRATLAKTRADKQAASAKAKADQKKQVEAKKKAVNTAQDSLDKATDNEKNASDALKEASNAVGRASEAQQMSRSGDSAAWTRGQGSIDQANRALEQAKAKLAAASYERIKKARALLRAQRASVVGGGSLLAAFAWDEWKHPRGRDGKFIEKGGIVNVLANAADDFGKKLEMRGKVTDLTPQGPEITYRDGSTEQIPLADVTKRVTAAPKSEATLKSPRKGMGDIELDTDTIRAMRSDPKSTAAKYLVDNPDGTTSFSPERQALHDEIIRKHTAGKAAPSGKPAFNVMGGGPAAGKSNMVQNAGISELTDDSAVMVNADEMKDELPEYQAMLTAQDAEAASLAHEESSYLAKRLQSASFEQGLNVTLDGTGDSSTAKMLKKIKEARDAGYAVNGFYTTVPTDVAVDRAYIRGEKIGRHVPESVIRGTHISVSQVFPDVFKEFDNAQLFQTEGALKPILSWDGKKATINDQNLYDQFVAKGKESTAANGPSPEAIARAQATRRPANLVRPGSQRPDRLATPPAPIAPRPVTPLTNRQKLDNVARMFGINSKQYATAQKRFA